MEPMAMPSTSKATVYGTLVPRNTCLHAIPNTKHSPTNATASDGLELSSSSSALNILYGIRDSVTVAIHEISSRFFNN